MSFVRTVLGDVDARSLGITYAHEHLIIDSPLLAERSPEISLPSVDEAIAEVALCRAAGAGTMVDAMPAGAGRNAEKLKAVSQATGVNVVMSAGLHLAMYYERDPATAGADELADRFVTDVESRSIPAGVIKIATGNDPLDARDRTLVEAAAAAHLRTGAPILTHCEGGRGGLSQVQAFAGLGVPADRLILSHTDKVTDDGFHRELLASGVNVEYDQALRQAPDEPTGTAWLTVAMIEAGHVDQLLLGTDGARRSMWTTLGGSPGLVWLISGLVDRLRQMGATQDAIDTLLIANPARCLAFREVGE